MTLILILLFSLSIILFAIVRLGIHPFLVLFVTAIIYGLLSGMSHDLILQSISDGFGGVLGNIGLLILLGVIMGTFLEKSGGALVIADKVLSWIGKKSVTLAMMVCGYLLSIPVFADSTFIMLNPINRVLSFKGKIPYAVTTVALALGVIASHCMVPPTPGPIATAGMLGADLGGVIFWGLIISVLALIPSYFFARWIASEMPLRVQIAIEESELKDTHKPHIISSFLPVIVPLVLIILASIAKYPTLPFGEGPFIQLLQFIGSPIIALSFGVGLSFLLPKKLDRQMLASSGWLGEALVMATPVILITGAGGVFGKMLQNSGIADLVSSYFIHTGTGILLPFLIAVALKTAQGSSTVAMVTTASIVAPLLSALGLEAEGLRVFVVLSIGAGAMAISHANDSFFWAVTQLSGLSTKQGNKSLSLGTMVLSFSAMLLIYLVVQLGIY